MRIELHHFNQPDKATADQLCWIIRGVGLLVKNMEKIMIDTSKILAAVAAEKTKVDSLIALAAGQSATMKDLSAQLAAAIANNDPAAVAQVQKDLDQAAADLGTETANVAAAIDANTPLPAPIPTPVAPAVPATDPVLPTG